MVDAPSTQYNAELISASYSDKKATSLHDMRVYYFVMDTFELDSVTHPMPTIRGFEKTSLALSAALKSEKGRPM